MDYNKNALENNSIDFNTGNIWFGLGLSLAFNKSCHFLFTGINVRSRRDLFAAH